MQTLCLQMLLLLLSTQGPFLTSIAFPARVTSTIYLGIAVIYRNSRPILEL